jgi:hypothetical protein
VVEMNCLSVESPPRAKILPVKRFSQGFLSDNLKLSDKSLSKFDLFRWLFEVSIRKNP